MSRFTKILVPIDFSDHSIRAIHYAAELSKTYNAPVTLLHAYQTLNYALPEGYVFYSPEQLAELTQAIDKQVLAAWAKRCGAECAAKWTELVGKKYGLTAKAN